MLSPICLLDSIVRHPVSSFHTKFLTKIFVFLPTACLLIGVPLCWKACFLIMRIEHRDPAYDQELVVFIPKHFLLTNELLIQKQLLLQYKILFDFFYHQKVSYLKTPPFSNPIIYLLLKTCTITMLTL